MNMTIQQMPDRYKAMLHKLNSRRGFSLTETLATLVIMSLVGIMVTTGIATASKAYKQITEHANAQLMLSTTITALHDELIYALPDDPEPTITGDSTIITFKHVENGAEIIKYLDTDGRKGICIGYGDSPEDTSLYPIVSYQNSASLYNNWKIEMKEEGHFSISVWICRSDGTELIRVDNYEIKPLN